jgi:hypothetical protein
MKTKIALAVALVALFLAVPSATPRGPKTPPASVGATVGCSENLDGVADIGTDTCIISFTGLDPGTTYHFVIDSSCGGGSIDTSRSGSATYSFTFVDLNDCGIGLTISVTTGSGRRTATVPITIIDNTGGVV